MISDLICPKRARLNETVACAVQVYSPITIRPYIQFQENGVIKAASFANTLKNNVTDYVFNYSYTTANEKSVGLRINGSRVKTQRIKIYQGESNVNRPFLFFVQGVLTLRWDKVYQNLVFIYKVLMPYLKCSKYSKFERIRKRLVIGHAGRN